MTTRAKPSRKLLSFAKRDWRAMCRQLAERGRGKRESGAFLLGRRDDDRKRVIRIVYLVYLVYLDDLDPNCLTGAITFDGRAYSALWDICDRDGLHVLGDVHTHPGTWVGQSDTDSNNPMLARDGHVALIFPKFAQGKVRLEKVGAHCFGKSGWTSWFGREVARQIKIGWL